MSSKKNADTAPATAAQSETNANAEPTYALDSLQKHCLKLFGVSTSTFVGATSGIDATKNYTINEIKSAIEKWCGKAVK